MKVVVSIGGSVLVPEPSGARVAEHADVIEELVADGCRVGAVVGGGGVAREYISAARDLGANEIELDQLGIDVTRLNARLLIAALGEDAVTAPATTYDEAGEALRRSDISVMGGVAPAQTTDAVGAALAEYVTPTCSSTRRAFPASTATIPTKLTTRRSTTASRRTTSST